MPAVEWRLHAFLKKHNITVYALTKASGLNRSTTLYRLARERSGPTRVDLPTLAAVIVGLRRLTGENVQISDLLEFVEEGKLITGEALK